MVTVPRETPSLPLMLRDYLAQYIWKSLGKSFFASEQRACQISLSLLSFCEAENIFAALVLNSASEAARGAEVQLLLRTRCLQLQVLELCDLWERTGAALCVVTVLEGGWGSGKVAQEFITTLPGLFSTALNWLWPCLCSSWVLFWPVFSYL